MMRRASLLLLVSIVMTGCGGLAPQAPREPVALSVYVPCQLSSPLQQAVTAFTSAHPNYHIEVLVDKPLAQLATIGSEKAPTGVVITLGEVEMQTLIKAGTVVAADLRPIARNTHPLAVIAPSAATKPTSLSALPSVSRLFIEDPAKSTLGARATEALKAAGLWEALASKVVRPQPNANILAEMLSGKADAALVLKGCLFAEKGTGGVIPKTVRIVGEFPADSFSPIQHLAAPLARTDNPKAAAAFVEFLTSTEGRRALAGAGLTPAGEGAS